MKYMLALGASLALATPALATVQVCTTPNCAPTDENVLVIKQVASNLILGATNNTHVGVLFTSPILEGLVGNANGQADITAADGLLNALTFTLVNGNTFGSAMFNLEPIAGAVQNETLQVILTYVLANGTTQDRQVAMNINGQNDNGIFGDAGERFTRITFLANPITTGWGDLRQLRLGDVQAAQTAVPEASTWAMMLVGFGAIGSTMRRKRAQHTVRRVSYA